MQRNLISPTRIAALAFLATAGLHAQPAATTPALVFDNGRGKIELIDRLRYEDRSNNFDFDSAAKAPTDDSWWVQRLRLGATWKPEAALAFQVQLQDAREWDSNRPGVPFIQGAEGNDPLDLRLASVTWGDPKTSPVQFTLGRQTILIGEERLVGASEWNNFARTFDAGKLVWNVDPGHTKVTAFVSSVVNVQPTTSGQGWKFDHSSSDDMFYGVNLTQTVDARTTGEMYVLWRDKKHNDPLYTAPTAPIPVGARTVAAYDIAQNIYTIGGRYVLAPKPGAFDVELEGAWQGGHVARQTTAATGQYAGSTAELTQGAWAVHSLIGYTPEGAPLKLRLTAEYNVATGDSHRSDDRNGSFMNLFPSNHKWYGFMDAFSWKNMEEWVGSIRFAPLPKTTVRFDYHSFSLFTTSDAWYRANGVTAVRPVNLAARMAPRDAGNEFDATVSWAPRPWLALDLGWSLFKAGSYLEATGAHSDARFFYVQTTLTF